MCVCVRACAYVCVCACALSASPRPAPFPSNVLWCFDKEYVTGLTAGPVSGYQGGAERKGVAVQEKSGERQPRQVRNKYLERALM